MIAVPGHAALAVGRTYLGRILFGVPLCPLNKRLLQLVLALPVLYIQTKMLDASLHTIALPLYKRKQVSCQLQVLATCLYWEVRNTLRGASHTRLFGRTLASAERIRRPSEARLRPPLPWHACPGAPYGASSGAAKPWCKRITSPRHRAGIHLIVWT